MNNRIKRIAKGMFEQFRHRKITESEFVQAEVKARNLGGYMDDFNVLIAMCKDTITGKYKMDKWNLSIIIGTILYVVSPIDAIPDFILVGGWIDDVAIVGYAIRKLSAEMEQYKRSKFPVETR
ncbi:MULTISPECIES: YkvA family protein [Sphingobacterium]|uniref:YkvA family protein n=1 Tax=Sphingobacterium TaxID=28453 RepID=UPI00258009D8|nr:MULTISPECIES: YkvA family protein [Sphingobacterium]